jgi:hypothetical protein
MLKDVEQLKTNGKMLKWIGQLLKTNDKRLK